MLKHLLLLPAAAIAIVGIACSDDDDDDDAATNTPGGSVQTTTPGGNETPGGDEGVEVTLDAQGADGVGGTAMLVENADGSSTTVSITLDDATAGGEAAIHTGSCDEWGDTPVATIGTVTSGSGTGSVDLGMAEIEAADHVVVVMPAAGGDPISCGEI